MDLKNILVTGTLSFTQADAWLMALCNRLGGVIGLSPNYRLLTGGMVGDKEYGSVDFHVAKGAVASLPNHEQQLNKVYTVVPDVEDGPVTFNMGQLVQSHVNNVYERRLHLVQLADFVITVAGGQGTVDLAKIAFEQQCPILPLYSTGGASRDLWQDPTARSEISEMIELDHPGQEQLMQLPADINEIMDIVLSCLKRTFAHLATE